MSSEPKEGIFATVLRATKKDYFKDLSLERSVILRRNRRIKSYVQILFIISGLTFMVIYQSFLLGIIIVFAGHFVPRIVFWLRGESLVQLIKADQQAKKE